MEEFTTWAVMYGSWGDCWGEYESLEKAQRIADKLTDRGEDAWIVPVD